VNKFSSSSLFLVTALIFSGCQTIESSSFKILSEEECRSVYIVKDPRTSRAYQIYESRYQDDNAKMNYLINLIQYSEVKILRNGSIMKGPEIAQGIRYKYKKHHAEAPTIDAFIKNIGSYSNKTSEIYYTLVDEHTICPTQYVLENEILRLDALS
jgi:hypothetical protein